MTDDPHGYLRLKRALEFIRNELLESDDSTGVEVVDVALSYFGLGSPSEFLGESLLAFETILGPAHQLAPSLRALVAGLIDEISEGFARVGDV